MANFTKLGTIFKSNSEYSEMSLKAESAATFKCYDGETISVAEGDYYVIRTVEEEKESLAFLLEKGILKQEAYDRNLNYLNQYGDNIRAIISVKKKK